MLARQRELGFGAVNELDKVGIMADDHQRRRRYGEHLDPHIGIAEIEQRDRTAQRRRAGCHGHVFSDEQHRKKDRHRNQGHAPVNKPDGRKAG